jgi:hypothetical protein
MSVRLRAVRSLTAFAVIGLSLVAIVQGCGIVGFVSARADAAARADRADALRSWIAVPGVAGEALTAMLSRLADPTDTDAARQRSETLSAILALQPLSTMNWLSLAGARLISQEAYDQVLAALTMSWLTGANEGSVMVQRGTFGLLQWEILSPAIRSRVIADLAGALLETTVRDGEIGPARTVLATKSADTRQEIAGLLHAQGVAANDLVRMGL